MPRIYLEKYVKKLNTLTFLQEEKLGSKVPKRQREFELLCSFVIIYFLKKGMRNLFMCPYKIISKLYF